jgi:hypothetical protein
MNMQNSTQNPARGLLGSWRAGEGLEFGAQVRGLGCADPLEYLQGLLQKGRGRVIIRLMLRRRARVAVLG